METRAFLEGNYWAAIFSEDQAELWVPPGQLSSALSKCLKSTGQPRTYYRCEFLCCRGSSLGCETTKKLSFGGFIFALFGGNLSVYKIQCLKAEKYGNSVCLLEIISAFQVYVLEFYFYLSTHTLCFLPQDASLIQCTY